MRLTFSVGVSSPDSWERSRGRIAKRLTCRRELADEREAQEFVARVRKEHPTATHNCFAYVLGADASVQKASDDGEPGGTAGVPMLQMLLRREMRYVVAVVTRYYGGVKLGAGGLIRAYGGVVGEALDELGTVTRQRFRLATVTVDHQRAGKLENDLRATGRAVRDVRYAETVTIEIGLPDSDVPAFRAWLAEEVRRAEHGAAEPG